MGGCFLGKRTDGRDLAEGGRKMERGNWKFIHDHGEFDWDFYTSKVR